MAKLCPLNGFAIFHITLLYMKYACSRTFVLGKQFELWVNEVTMSFMELSKSGTDRVQEQCILLFIFSVFIWAAYG